MESDTGAKDCSHRCPNGVKVEALKKDVTALKAVLRRVSQGEKIMERVAKISSLERQLHLKAAEARKYKELHRYSVAAAMEEQSTLEARLRMKELELKRATETLAVLRNELKLLRERHPFSSKKSTPLKKDCGKMERESGLCTPTNQYIGSAERAAPTFRAVSPSSSRKGAPSPRKVYTPLRTSLARVRTPLRSAGMTGKSLCVGDHVTWHGMQGTIRYLGAVAPLRGEDVWAGVELVAGRGDHDGTLDGITYFTAPPTSSVFCPRSEIDRLPTEETSCVRTTPHLRISTIRATEFRPENRSARRELLRKAMQITPPGRLVASAAVETIDQSETAAPATLLPNAAREL